MFFVLRKARPVMRVDLCMKNAVELREAELHGAFDLRRLVEE